MEEWTPRSLAYRDFVTQGEDETRRQLREGILDGDVGCLAVEWLRQFDDLRESERTKALDAAALSAAASARDQAASARESNTLARQAQKLAKIANATAIVAIIMSIITLIHTWGHG